MLGGDVSEGRVDALPIIVSLDVGEQVAPGLVPGRPSSLVDELDLMCMEEALHRGIIVTTAGSAHGGRRLHVSELLAIGLGCVLAAAIRVADETSPRSLPLGGHHQSRRRQFGPHVLAYGPADDLASGEIEDGGQVEPALAGGQIGDIGEPDRVGHRSRELLFEEVGRNRQVVAAISRARPEPTPCQSPDTVLAHQALHPPATDRSAVRAQGRMHPRRAIAPMMPSMETPDVIEELTVRHRPGALGA